MNTNNGEQLKAAAQAGNIDLLYTVIEDDPFILEHIDSVPFVETPLHIAAALGHLQFATEIMMLKPSFAWKLNPQGFSPIHLAMQKDHKRLVYRFVNINKDLVRIQGREAITPLHFASEIGEVDLLAKFLKLCPESIEYLTVRHETALHIAIKNQQFEALQVLVGWLKSRIVIGAQKLENQILNKRDEAGNTILHISALSTECQAVRLLVKTKINLNTMNLESKTALDMASTPRIKSMLFRVGAKPSLEVAHAPTIAHRFKTGRRRSKFRIRANMTEENRNTWLIIATLVATAIYQTGLSPPGGIYQVSAGDDNGVNITSSNSTISTPDNAGKSVLSGYKFFLFLIVNLYPFTVSIIAIYLMIPTLSGQFMGFLVASPVGWFSASHLFNMWRISPTHVNSMILFIVFASFLFTVVFHVIWNGVRYSRAKRGMAKLNLIDDS